MSEQPIDYYPGPNKFWQVNSCNKVPPFFDEGSRFTIRPGARDSFWLVLEFASTKLEVPLDYSFTNLFMNAKAFTLPGDPSLEYLVNFKLAPPLSVGRTRRTLYCTVQTQNAKGFASDKSVEDSEQGVFGAEEDGGGNNEEIPPTP